MLHRNAGNTASGLASLMKRRPQLPQIDQVLRILAGRLCCLFPQLAFWDVLIIRESGIARPTRQLTQDTSASSLRQFAIATMEVETGVSSKPEAEDPG